QITVHFLHEAVEMRAAFRREREARVEQIHDPGLAAPDTAPQVHAPGRGAVAGEPAQQAFAERRAGGFGEFGAQALELADRVELGSVGGEATLGDLLFVESAEDVGSRGHKSW